MDKPEARVNGPRGEGSKKRSALSTHGKRPRKAARMEASSDTRRLRDILVPRRQSDEGEDMEVKRIVRACDVKEGVVLSLAQENQDAMTYVKLGSRYLDAKRLRWLPCLGRVQKDYVRG